jgi:hypothetical protein
VNADGFARAFVEATLPGHSAYARFVDE